MKELVILRALRTGALADGKGAFVEIETNEGPRQLRFTADDAEHLIATLREALKHIHAARTKSGKPPLAASRTAQRWETSLDPVEQEAVLRTHFSDGTSEETHIPRSEIGGILRFLQQALRRFEAGAEMRQ